MSFSARTDPAMQPHVVFAAGLLAEFAVALMVAHYARWKSRPPSGSYAGGPGQR